MTRTVLCLLAIHLSAGVCRAQQGYSLQPGSVVIDSREHWERWHSIANTTQIGDDGIRPAFVRKNTRLNIDGDEVVVPGINAVDNASEFGGGILAVGSNSAGALDLMDGRMDTYWEPNTSDLLQDWWVQIDLGRTVSATKIVLKFVGEELGDPFLQFKVTTSQGETTIGPLLFRTRFTTNRPIKNERVFEIDLTRQPATKFPDVAGDFTGDVIRYIGIGITDSDFSKARRVSEAEYDGLPPAQRGAVEYFRRDSNRDRVLDGKEDWDNLAGTDRQGPVVYYRRELPRLAEIEVWSIGDNIGAGVLTRGGAVSSWENNGAEGAVVDGDFFGEVLYWPAQGGYNPDRLLPSEPPDVERSLVIDLAGSFFLDNIRVIHAAATSRFPTYRVQVSDGSKHAGGSLAWKTVGAFENLGGNQRYNDLKFPLTKVEQVAFTYRLRERGGRHGLAEMQFFGEGYMPESQITSAFGGASPFIELANTAQNLATIEWDADVPQGTDLILRTRTGNTVKTITRYFKKNGEEYPGTEEESAEQHASDKKFFGESSVGPVVGETIPGSDWSGWSQRYFKSGDKITSPSPRKFVAVQATFVTDDPQASAVLRSLRLNFVTPVAGTIVGEVLPSRLDEIGGKQELSYFIRTRFESGSRGIDEVLIQAPEGVDMKLKQVSVEVTGQQAVTYVPASDELEVIMDNSDSLWVRLPEAIKTTNGSALIEVQYEATIFGFNTFFIGSTGHSAFENSWQRVDDGDANGLTDSETTVVLALERGDVLGGIEVDRAFTPNGDGTNDELQIGFSLLRLGASTPVRVEVYDLSGRLVSTLRNEQLEAGRHTLAWSGVDDAGSRAAPGIYLLRIEIDVDSSRKKNTSRNRLVHIAY